MHRQWWKDADVRLAREASLMDLIGQLDALTRNDQVLDDPQLLAAIGKRMAEVLDELAIRADQLVLEYDDQGSSSS